MNERKHNDREGWSTQELEDHRQLNERHFENMDELCLITEHTHGKETLTRSSRNPWKQQKTSLTGRHRKATRRNRG